MNKAQNVGLYSYGAFTQGAIISGVNYGVSSLLNGTEMTFEGMLTSVVTGGVVSTAFYGASQALQSIRASRINAGAKGSAVESTGGNRSVGAAKRQVYEASPKHGSTAKGSISAAPQNGQEALDLSLQIKSTSPRRVGIDYQAGQFNIFDQTSEGVFHGHVRAWNELTSEMQRVLRNAGMVNSRGRIL